jgi:hypothetical protein
MPIWCKHKPPKQEAGSKRTLFYRRRATAEITRATTAEIAIADADEGALVVGATVVAAGVVVAPAGVVVAAGVVVLGAGVPARTVRSPVYSDQLKVFGSLKKNDIDMVLPCMPVEQ